MKLVVLVPALNEASTIGAVIRSIPTEIAGVTEREVLVVDDGSRDRTAEIARAAGAFVLSCGENRGVGWAFRRGLEASLVRGADFVVQLDADGQFPAEQIPTLLQPLREGRADIVLGSRFRDPALTPPMPRVKAWGNRLVAGLVNAATGENFTDVSCGFRALTRETALRLTLFGDFTYTQEMIVDAVRKGLRLVEVPVRVRPREFGTSRVYTSAPAYALRSAVILFRAFRDGSPLRVFGGAALLFGLLGLGSGGYVFLHWLKTGQTFPFRSLVTVAAVLLLLGAFFLTVALLGDMQKRHRILVEELLYYARRAAFHPARAAAPVTSRGALHPPPQSKVLP